MTLLDQTSEQAILADLNDEQRAAVQHPEGPLLIVAGAGTGKTQVITRRIAWLITSKRARPEQILALTFTDKAAVEMESRVDRLVPYGFVGATISTFHAFCDALVRERAIELGLSSQLRVERQAEILVFLRERLFELGLDRYLPLGRPDTHLAHLVALFDRARDEDVSPADYATFAAGLAAAGGDDAALDRAASEAEKSRAYAAYQRLLREHDRMDFGAQIALALDLLRTRAHVLRELQSRYRYILVDEIQDTNHVQFELVRLLAGTERGEPRNLTVVGDDDQSIYRFRGAKIENLMSFVTTYPDARVLVLRRNYRSRQRILDLAHQLVAHNDPERLERSLGYDKRLVAERGAGGDVEHRAFSSASDEAEWVAAEIADAIQSGNRESRDFAVLTRAHRSLDPFAQALHARGIRFRRSGRRVLYSRPEIQLCLNVLRTLANPEDSAAAHLALGDALFGADPADLARLGARSRDVNRPLLALARTAAEAGHLADRTREAVRRFLDLHQRLSAIALKRSTAEVLYEFVSESGWLGTLAADDSAESTERAQNLNRLFQLVQRVGGVLRQDRVHQFIPHLDLLIEMGDDPAAAEIETDENAVQLLTAHNAKGLEFPVVFIAHLIQGRFPATRRGEALPFPPELRRGRGDEAEDLMREERRLFYVAMTRARDRLVLTHAGDYGGRRAARVSPFVLEALGLPAPPKNSPPSSALQSSARHAPAPEAAVAATATVPEGTPLQLSNLQIDDYLECPLKYRYAHVMKVPLLTHPAAMYGQAVHNAIQRYLQDRLNGYPTEPENLVRTFEDSWSSIGFLSREHEERRLEEGRDLLRRFYAREEASPLKPQAVEREFHFTMDGDEVRGRWDRIDVRGTEVVLVDYKTAAIDDAAKAEERARKSLKDDQLGLYALAYREATGTAPQFVELNYVAHGVVGRAAVEAEHLERAHARVARAARGIRGGEFAADPDQMKCGFCPYSRFCPHSAARAGS